MQVTTVISFSYSVLKRLLYQSPLKMELYGTVLLSFVHTKMCRVAIGLIRSKEIKIGPSAISEVYNNLIFLGLSHSTFTKQFHGCTILKEKYFDNNGTIFLVIHISFFHQFSSTMVKDKFHNFNHTQYGLTLYQTPNFKVFQSEGFEDKNFRFDKNSRKLSKWVEISVGKNEQILLFPKCFQKTCTAGT